MSDGSSAVQDPLTGRWTMVPMKTAPVTVAWKSLMRLSTIFCCLRSCRRLSASNPSNELERGDEIDRRLKRDDAIPGEFSWHDSVLLGIVRGAGEPTRAALEDLSGKHSLSVVGGVVRYSERELMPSSLDSLKFEVERVSIDPKRFVIDIGFDPAIVADVQGTIFVIIFVVFLC